MPCSLVLLVRAAVSFGFTTSFTFRSSAQLTDTSQLAESCRPNRGPASAPLFLVNNWVDTTPVPRVSMAALVNARPALLPRTETRQRL